jgi:DNA-directed RNA polymerase specialized sigma24 family protein
VLCSKRAIHLDVEVPDRARQRSPDRFETSEAAPFDFDYRLRDLAASQRPTAAWKPRCCARNNDGNLLGRYSNQELLTRLERVLHDRNNERPSSRPRASRQKQTQTRLSDEELDIVVAGYEDGLSLEELSSAFGADRRALANRLEQRGISRRRRRLTDEEIQEAITLYGDGWSPARIATRFGVYPQSIRYRLRQRGVTLRPRPGR